MTNRISSTGREQRGVENLERDKWLEGLLDPAVSVDFVTYGYAPLTPEWGFTDRVVDEHLVYFVIENELAADVGGRSWSLRQGGFCLLPPNTRHTFAHAEKQRPVTLHYFRLDLRRGELNLHLDHLPVILEAAPTLREHLERLHDSRQSRDTTALLRVRASLALMFSTAFLLAKEPLRTNAVLSYKQRSRLYDLVRQATDQHLHPAELARQLDLSLDYFTRRFKRTFGIPPRRWIVEQRIEVAKTLLADSTLNVSQIAVQLHYSDLFQFSRQFKQVTGLSPRDYRKRLSDR